MNPDVWNVDPKEIPDGMGCVRLVRNPKGALRSRMLRIWINQSEQGLIRAGDARTFYLDPGIHHLHVFNAQYRSDIVAFSISAGEALRFYCGARKSIIGAFLTVKLDNVNNSPGDLLFLREMRPDDLDGDSEWSGAGGWDEKKI